MCQALEIQQWKNSHDSALMELKNMAEEADIKKVINSLINR